MCDRKLTTGQCVLVYTFDNNPNVCTGNKGHQAEAMRPRVRKQKAVFYIRGLHRKRLY